MTLFSVFSSFACVFVFFGHFSCSLLRIVTFLQFNAVYVIPVTSAYVIIATYPAVCYIFFKFQIVTFSVLTPFFNVVM